MNHNPLIITIVLFLAASMKAVGGEYDESWNKPTIRARSFDYKYVKFGMIDPFKIAEPTNTIDIPPIPGLELCTNYYVCPIDSCRATWHVLAYRCPDQPKLQEWMAIKAEDYYNAGAEYSLTNCLHSMHEPTMNEQWGMLLVDCWCCGDYYMFYVNSWYDMYSCGNNDRESYITIDATTGKELTLSSFIPSESYGALGKLMLKYLSYEDGELYTNHFRDKTIPKGEKLLTELSGCAFIREGFVLFFDPYVLDCGAAGALFAVIPYKKLSSILRPEFLQ